MKGMKGIRRVQAGLVFHTSYRLHVLNVCIKYEVYTINIHYLEGLGFKQSSYSRHILHASNDMPVIVHNGAEFAYADT